MQALKNAHGAVAADCGRRMRRGILLVALAAVGLSPSAHGRGASAWLPWGKPKPEKDAPMLQAQQAEPVAPGVWRIRLGEPEPITPVATRSVPIAREGFAALPAAAKLPIDVERITATAERRGCVVTLPMAAEEHIYGLGLQLGSLEQTGLKKTLRVNSDPVADLGDSHAPVPFYVSTAGYGVLVDTARYAAFYAGSHERVAAQDPAATVAAEGTADVAPANNTEALYAARELSQKAMVIDIPAARGVDLYIFAGPTLGQAVQRYNLFSGGGCLPAMWGLGVWYRAYAGSTHEDIARLAGQMRERHMPCDVFGLEPGWQSHAYSCSLAWDAGRYPDPAATLENLTRQGLRPNLWEHVFIHPTAPIYAALRPYSADWAVWGGLVPDMTLAPARAIFTDYHRQTFVERGVAGFKLDECDNSDYIAFPWSYPEWVMFPSGADGEQMHSLLPGGYKQALLEAFHAANNRTYSQVRAGHALAAPQPFVLYSDLYDHRQFIRGICTSAFSGLLWSPEVRQCSSGEDLIRRLQTVVCSPQALLNAWMIKNPPWLQYDMEKNNRGELLENHAELEAQCREIYQLRMRLVPYLYAAFARYWREGRPPFRPLVMDWPADPNVLKIDDQYMMGDALLVAPVVAGQAEREVYLPAGTWYDFWTRARLEGGRKIKVRPPLMQIPLYVKDDTLLPLARPVEHIARETCFELEVLAFGAAPADVLLQEDDGESYDFERGDCNRVRLSWPAGEQPRLERSGPFKGERYRIVQSTRVPR